MRKILLLLTLVSTFAFSAIDECKTDVYFGNGILTIKEDAISNAGILEKAIKQMLGSNFSKKIGKVSYAYNDTFRFGQDIYESALQITNLSAYVDWWAKHLPGYKQSVHEANIEAQVDKYEASIRLGHRVLVVAHSQGNLFAIEATKKPSNHRLQREKYYENTL